jgi:iron-sulfur cluster repair protein YtfE (RIC family)
MFGRGRTSGVLKWSLIGSAIAGGIALIPLVPALKKKAMRATTILMKDHRMVSGLLMTLEMTPKFSALARKTVFDQIRDSLMVHTQVEEEIFYPAIRNLAFGGESGKVDEAYREHQTVKDLLNQMSNMDASSDEFDRKLAELKRNIQHHVNEEENEMFPLVTSRMSSGRLEDIGKRIHDRKMNLKTQMAA